MFGTLVSTTVDLGGLEFVKNPDSAAAVSRNLRDKIHISCMFCRSRKARCSGGPARCQRCAIMGTECVYPSTHVRGASKRDKSGSRTLSSSRQSSSRQSTMRSSSDGDAEASPRPLATFAASGDATASAAALADLPDLAFDNDDGLTPWMSMMGSPMAMQPYRLNFDSGPSASASSGDDSPNHLGLGAFMSGSSSSRSATVPPADHLSSLSRTDTLDVWDHGPLGRSQAMAMKDQMVIDSQGKVNAAASPDKSADSSRLGGCCLLRAIAFLERLLSQTAAAACEVARIDSLLAELRSAIETLAGFVHCERCAGLAELSMLLVMAARPISILCRRNAGAYQGLVNACGTASGSDSPQRPSSQQQQQQQQQSPLRQQQALEAATALVDISVATYKPNPRERLHLLQSLLTLQMGEFQGLVLTLKATCCSVASNQGQIEALAEAEYTVKLALRAIGARHESV